MPQLKKQRKKKHKDSFFALPIFKVNYKENDITQINKCVCGW